MTPDRLAKIHAVSMEFPAPWSTREFKSILAAKSSFLIPVDVEDKLVGFALGQIVLDEAELLTIAIAPNARRAGLGRHCLDRFETKAAALGAKTAYLEVAETNLAARALYAGNGWQETGLRKAYYRAPQGKIDAILMQKRLPAG